MGTALMLKNPSRRYCPEQGRFISRDPIGFAGADFNLYRYVTNNPLRYKDPYGLENSDSGESDRTITYEANSEQQGEEGLDNYMSDAEVLATAATGGTCAAAAKFGGKALNNRFVRVGFGNFPNPGSLRISLGRHQGQKYEIGLSLTNGKVAYKVPGGKPVVIIKGR